MAMDRRKIDPPRDEQVFENWCQLIYSRKLSCPGLKLYGRRGQRQHGIDLLGPDTNRKLVVVQAKLRNQGLLTCDEITRDFDAALQHFTDLTHFVFATTQSRDTALQEHVLKLNRDHSADGLTVEIDFWEDIEDTLHEAEFGEIFRAANDSSISTSALERHEANQKVRHAEVIAAIEGISQPGNSSDKQIEEAAGYTSKGRPETAYDLLSTFKQEHWENLDDRLRYRVLANLGIALHGLDRFQEAAACWIDAYKYQQTSAAELLYARGLQFLGERERAMESVGSTL